MVMDAEVVTSTRSNGLDRIVVGFDGSNDSRVALEWAVVEANILGAELDVVHVDFWDPQVRAFPGYDRQTDVEAAVLAEGVAAARASSKDLVVVGRRELPPAGEALVRAAEGARILVVGSKHMSPLQRWVLGSVSRYCVEHAQCPVVVVHEPGSPGGGAVAAARTEPDEMNRG